MAVVLLAGLGLGVGVGVLVGRRPAPVPPSVTAEVAAPPPSALAPAESPALREEDGPPIAPPTVVPVVPPPAVRPGEGPASIAAPDLLVPPPPAQAGRQPAWVHFAVPAPNAAGRPMIAVVIDDLGLDRKRSDRVAALGGPLTLAFMTYAEDLDQQTAAAHAHGHELMVHMPMQPMNGGFDAGPDVLEVGLPPDELRRRVEWGLSRFEGYVGVNNHMGSRFTADAAGMRVVMQALARHGLMFLDSVTTEKTVGAEVAREAGVPFAARQVFLDNTQTVGSVRAQLDKVEQIARHHGAAIAIGHPHDATIEALSGWLPTLAARGFVLVPVTAIVRAEAHQG